MTQLHRDRHINTQTLCHRHDRVRARPTSGIERALCQALSKDAEHKPQGLAHGAPSFGTGRSTRPPQLGVEGRRRSLHGARDYSVGASLR